MLCFVLLSLLISFNLTSVDTLPLYCLSHTHTCVYLLYKGRLVLLLNPSLRIVLILGKCACYFSFCYSFFPPNCFTECMLAPKLRLFLSAHSFSSRVRYNYIIIIFIV